MKNLKKKINNSQIILLSNSMSRNYDQNLTKMFKWMKKIKLSHKPVIFDVGANIGVFSLSYATIYRSASVYSFEPVNFIFKILKKNIKKNTELKKRIKIFNFGFSNTTSYLKLSIPTFKQHKRYGNSNINSGLYSIHGKGKKKSKASFISIDNFVKKKNIKKIDFIKIDVEGHEYNVLQGAIKTINKFRPIIIFEFNEITKALSKYSYKDYAYLIKKINYRIFGLKYGWADILCPIKSLKNTQKISDLVIMK